MIANKLRKNKNVEAYEEVTSMADNGWIVRCGIIVINQIRSRRVILDQTVTFERSNEHIKDINEKKCTLTTQQFYTLKQIVKF